MAGSLLGSAVKAVGEQVRAQRPAEDWLCALHAQAPAPFSLSATTHSRSSAWVLLQMAAAGREAQSVANEARAAIEADSRVRDRMGGSVQVGSPISQSSMSSSINGRVTKQVRPVFP